MYNFLFDRKSLVLLAAGLVTAGGLLFSAGLVIGVQWGLPGSVAVPAAPAGMPRQAAFRASRPCPPAVAPAQAESPAASVAPADTPEATPFAEPSPEPMQGTAPIFEQRAELDPAPEPERVELPGDPVPIASVSSPAPAASPAPEPAAPVETAAAGRFALQIGAFRQAANSAKVVQDLQSRGYAAWVVGPRGRSTLRTVLVGRYADRGEAARAAVELRQSTGMEAVVRTAPGS